MPSPQQTVQLIPLGYDLTKALQELSRIRDYYSNFPFVRRAAVEYGRPSGNDDQEGMVNRLTQFVKNNVVYVADPNGFELVQAPDLMLADIMQRGRATGDCDDHVLLFTTLLASLGFQTKIVAVKLPGSPDFNHVIASVYLRNTWVDIDLCAKSKGQPTYTSQYSVQ